MVDSRRADTSSLNAPDVDVDETLRELAGEEPRDRQDGILDTDQIDVNPGTITDTALYEGESGPMDTYALVNDPANLELLEGVDLRSDETTDPIIAAEEGLAWVPPTDPPIVPFDGPEGAAMAAGFSVSSLDGRPDADTADELLPVEDEMTDRVRGALRADASTTEYADSIDIETDGATVILRGVVTDIEDDDNLVAVASSVIGVDDVVDELDVEGV